MFGLKRLWKKGGELGISEIVIIVIIAVVLLLMVSFVLIAIKGKGFGEGGILDSIKNLLRSGRGG